MRKRPIRVRLTVWYALFVAGTVIGFGAFLALELRSNLRSRIDREVRASSATIAQSYAQEGVGGFREIGAAALRRSGSDAQVLDERGHVVASYGGDIAEDPMVSSADMTAALEAKPRLRDVNLGDSGQPFRVLAAAATRNGRKQVVVVAEPLGSVSESVRSAIILLLIAAPVLVAAAVFGGWWLVKGALAPVERMRRKAEQIGIDRLHERLTAPNAHDEVGQLATTLNAMLDRLESGVAANRQLIADASHELRTPLAAMRAELDITLRDSGRRPEEREVLESIREEVLSLSRTVENLMTLARADEGRLDLARGELDLDQAIDTAARSLRPLADAKGVRLHVGGEPARAEGDSQRLGQALANLIENAIKFTPPGGEVTVSSWRRDAEVGITVADTGPGIPTHARERIFDRFYRADPSRSRESGGSGLGLAICHEIVEAHGGRIWVRSEEGEGSEFSIALPGN